jgi:hypothetical protein
MTKIVDTGISIISQTATNVQLALGVDTRFTGVDLSQGQTGAATFEMTCKIWDDDTFSDDLIASKSHVMEPGSILELTGVDMPFSLSLAQLRKKEPSFEKTLEIFGEFTLRKNGLKLGPSAKSRTIDIKLPGPPPPTPTGGQHIDVVTEGTGGSTIVVTKGSKFTPGSVVVVRITDSHLVQLQSVATADADGKFTSRKQVPCLSGVRFTITAFEDTNPTGTFANAVVATCP